MGSRSSPAVYIATGLANAASHNRLRDRLAHLGIGLTYDWTEHGPVWQRGHEGIRAVAASEAQGVIGADLVIAIMPGGRGTHAEIGIAIGAGVPVLFVPSDRGQIEGPETCAFYHHPLVTIAAHADLDRLAYEVAVVLAEQPAPVAPPVVLPSSDASDMMVGLGIGGFARRMP